MNVIKRDGSEQIFESNKIRIAIIKANNSVKEDKRIKDSTINTIVSSICSKCNALKKAVHIEEIQDMVEDELIDRRAKAVAKAYVVYRYEHQLIRDRYSALMQKVSNKIFAKNVSNQNANVDERSFGGRMGEASDVLMREFAINYIMSPKAKFNHENNRVYIHDLNAYSVGMPNCLSIPYDHLLNNGFETRSTDVRGARSANTAFQLNAVIAQLQSLQQFGGVSATHLDWSLVPYVRLSFMKHFVYNYFKDTDKYFNLDTASSIDDIIEEIKANKQRCFHDLNISEKDLYFDSPVKNKYSKYYKQAVFDTILEAEQGVEGLLHNLNTLQSRSGNQLPFTSINYGACTLPEGRLISQKVLQGAIKGLGKHHRTSVFPCMIWQAKKGINLYKRDPNYDLFRLALKATSLRLYPNYCNCDWSVQQACVKMDRDLKKRVLNSLSSSDYNKLSSMLDSHPDQLPLLGLKFVNNKLTVNMEETPLEMNGTMGKCNMQPI